MMGLSHDMSGNNCFVNNCLSMSGNECETLLLQTNAQNISLIERQTHEWTPIESVNIDMNQLIINTNELNPNESQQQILYVSSPLDLMSKQSTVQMVLPEMPLMGSRAQLNVIQVPTNLLLADNNLIVIPQEGITLEVPSIETSIDNCVNYENKNWFNSSELMIQGIDGFNSNINVDEMGLVSVAVNDCIAINGINKSINCFTNDNNNQNNYFQNNNQIIGIIDDQTEETNVYNNIYNTDYDLNTFLASTLCSTTHEECDPNQAKQWHNDSVIAYRALNAFKKVMPKHSCVQNN